MKELLPQIQNWLGQNKKVALATVVKTWGSAPREVGSMMAISRESEMAGSVSGGCVETAVIEEALKVISTAKPALLSYGVTNEEAWTVGLACGGSIEIFVEAFDPADALKAALLDIVAHKKTAVLATCLDTDSEFLGRQYFIEDSGKVIGSIDNGEIDAALQKTVDLQNPPRDAKTVELHGHAVFIKPFLPPPRFVIIGGVHIAQPLAKFAKELEFEVILIDPRTAFGNKTRFPEIGQIINLWPDEALAQLDIDQNTFIVLLTHDPKIDDPGIIAALNAHPAYIGVLGSRKTHEKRIKRLKEAGISKEQIARIHAPIGLKIGARSPAEIAMSIMAEIITIQRKPGYA
ncbi:MAG: XdhC family protein [bacterium]